MADTLRFDSPDDSAHAGEECWTGRVCPLPVPDVNTSVSSVRCVKAELRVCPNLVENKLVQHDFRGRWAGLTHTQTQIHTYTHTH